MIKKFSFNAFYIIYAVFSTWILLSGFFAADGSFAGNGVMMCGMLFAFGILAFVAAKAPQIAEKPYKIAVAFMFAIFYIALTSFGIITMTAPVSDLEVLVRVADHWLKNGNIVNYSYYFTICKNTLGNAIFIYLMFIPMHLLGIDIRSDMAECWGIAVNCLMLVLAVYCLYRIAVRILKNRNFQMVFLLLCMCCIPFYLWAHRYYSDTLSLPFLSLSVLLYLKARENNGKKKIIFSVLCGISLWVGYFIRGGIVIVLVAIVLFSAFCDKKDFIRTGLCILMAFIITMCGWNLYVNNNSWIDYSNKARDDFPLTMWLMYGAHDEGNYSDEDVTLLKSYPDYESRKAVAKEKLKEYYSQYNLKSYLEFLNLKYGITYGNGLFDTEQYLNNQRHGNFTHYFLLDGMPFTALFRYVANGLHFFTVAMAVVSGFINWRKKQWNVPMLMQIILLGNIIFFSFWETKARYAFGIIPVLIFLAVYSLKEIAEFAADKVNFKK